MGQFKVQVNVKVHVKLKVQFMANANGQVQVQVKGSVKAYLQNKLQGNVNVKVLSVRLLEILEY